jgi:hypothetical protein
MRSAPFAHDPVVDWDRFFDLTDPKVSRGRDARGVRRRARRRHRGVAGWR